MTQFLGASQVAHTLKDLSLHITYNVYFPLTARPAKTNTGCMVGSILDSYLENAFAL